MHQPPHPFESLSAYFEISAAQLECALIRDPVQWLVWLIKTSNAESGLKITPLHHCSDPGPPGPEAVHRSLPPPTGIGGDPSSSAETAPKPLHL